MLTRGHDVLENWHDRTGCFSKSTSCAAASMAERKRYAPPSTRRGSVGAPGGGGRGGGATRASEGSPSGDALPAPVRLKRALVHKKSPYPLTRRPGTTQMPRESAPLTPSSGRRLRRAKPSGSLQLRACELFAGSSRSLEAIDAPRVCPLTPSSRRRLPRTKPSGLPAAQQRASSSPPLRVSSCDSCSPASIPSSRMRPRRAEQAACSEQAERQQAGSEQACSS